MVSSHEELGLVLDFVAPKHAEAARQSATDAEAVGESQLCDKGCGHHERAVEYGGVRLSRRN